MKSKIIPFILVVLLPHIGSAQIKIDTTHYKNVFKFDIFNSTFSDEFVFTYERVIGKQTSLALTGGFYSAFSSENFADDFGTSRYSEFRVSGWLIQPEFRYYLMEYTGAPSPHQVYLSIFPHVSFQNRRELGEPYFMFDEYQWVPDIAWQDIDTQEDRYGLGVSAGAQVFMKDGLGLEVQIYWLLFYSDHQRVGTEWSTLTGQPNDVSSRTVSRLASSGVRLNLCFGR